MPTGPPWGSVRKPGSCTGLHVLWRHLVVCSPSTGSTKANGVSCRAVFPPAHGKCLHPGAYLCLGFLDFASGLVRGAAPVLFPGGTAADGDLPSGNDPGFPMLFPPPLHSSPLNRASAAPGPQPSGRGQRRLSDATAQRRSCFATGPGLRTRPLDQGRNPRRDGGAGHRLVAVNGSKLPAAPRTAPAAARPDRRRR